MLAQVLMAEADCFRASCRESGCHAIVLNAAFNLASSSFDSDVFNTRGLGDETIEGVKVVGSAR